MSICLSLIRGIKACSDLGVMYAQGGGVTQDHLEALKLYGKACDGGNALGCYNLAYIYDHGIYDYDANGYSKAVLKIDGLQAANIYTKSCNGGVATACYNLGGKFLVGASMQKDSFKAAQLFEKACDGEDMRGCSMLGFFYEEGKVIKKNLYKATKLYEKACNGGHKLYSKML